MDRKMGLVVVLASLAICGPAALPVARRGEGPAQVRDYRFDGTMSREVLENYLSRAITMEGLLNGHGDLEDNIRMLKTAGAKFIGRSLCLWGGEAQVLNNLQRAKQQAPRLHQADPDMILQGCIFEIVTTQVDRVPVPDWAFVALGQPVENRHLPYLVEIDNWGVSRQPGQPRAGGCWVWGYDEITWFAHQSQEYRANWLRYAWDWVRRTDPNGYLQMPGSRTLVSPLDRKRWYYANAPSPAVADGLGDEDAIRALWAADAR